MSKADLIRELEKLRRTAALDDTAAAAGDMERTLHALHVHQVELEMQNRELREAQERLDGATARYAELFDFAPVGYCTMDAMGVIVELNLTAASLFTARRDDLIGAPFVSVAPLEDRQAFHRHLVECRDRGGAVRSELVFRSEAGGPRDVELITDVVRSAGAPTSLRTVMVDITEQKRNKRRLRVLATAGEHLATSLEYGSTLDTAARLAVPELADLCMLDVVVDGGVDRRVFAASEQQASLVDGLTGLRPELGPRTPQARVIESGEPMMLAAVSKELQAQLAAADEQADGVRPAAIQSLLVVPLTARGRTCGAMTLAATTPGRTYAQLDLEIAQDLARRIALALDNARLYAEAQTAHAVAQRAIQARDEVLGIVAHDLRTPLGNIVLQAALLRPRRAGPERRSHRPAEAIERAATRMDRLIRDLLDVTRMEGGRIPLNLRTVDVRELVMELADAQEELAAKQQVALEFDLAPEIGQIVADRDRLERAIENLVSNASRYTPAGGRITIGAHAHGGEILITVTDTGSGIKPEDLPHIFDRFYQARARERQGAGLGLQIVKGIVEAHGGQVWAASELGIGTKFSFTIPRTPAD